MSVRDCVCVACLFIFSLTIRLFTLHPSTPSEDKKEKKRKKPTPLSFTTSLWVAAIPFTAPAPTARFILQDSPTLALSIFQKPHLRVVLVGPSCVLL